MRLPCPVGHYDLLSIEGENLPPSLLTPPLCGQTRHPATTVLHPGGQVAFLGFLRHPPTPLKCAQVVYGNIRPAPGFQCSTRSSWYLASSVALPLSSHPQSTSR